MCGILGTKRTLDGGEGIEISRDFLLSFEFFKNLSHILLYIADGGVTRRMQYWGLPDREVVQGFVE